MGLTTGQTKSNATNNSQKQESNSSPLPQPNNANPNNSQAVQDVSQTAGGVERSLWGNSALEKENKLAAQRNNLENDSENEAAKGSPQIAAQGGKIETGVNQNYRAAQNPNGVDNFRNAVDNTTARVESEEKAQNEKLMPQAYSFFNNIQFFLNQKREQLQTAQEKIAEEKPPRKGIEDQQNGFQNYKKDIQSKINDCNEQITKASEKLEKVKQAVKDAEASGKKKAMKQAKEDLEKAELSQKSTQTSAEKQAKKFQTILDELVTLENSDVIYQIVPLGNKNTKVTSKGGELRFGGIDKETGREILQVCYQINHDLIGEMEALAHELKHAYQYETGLLSFFQHNKAGEKAEVDADPKTYDYYDEYEAFERQMSYTETEKYSAFGPSDIVKNSTKDENINRILADSYPSLPKKTEKNASIYDTEKNNQGIVNANQNRKKHNAAAKYFYKGFQKDNDIIDPALYEGTYKPK